MTEADSFVPIVIKRWDEDFVWDEYARSYVTKHYEVRKYPAGTRHGEYQKWCNDRRVCECQPDGRDLGVFSFKEKTQVEAATATFEDIFDDIRVLANMLRDDAQKEAINRDINEEQREFLSTYGEQDGGDALTRLVRFVVRIRGMIPPAEEKAMKVATFLENFCEKMRDVYSSHRVPGLTFTEQIQALLKEYYKSSNLPLALLLAKLKRFG